MEPETKEQIEKPKKFEELHKVTPLSKYLAMIIFIIMPFIGGWIGYMYGLNEVKYVEETTVAEAQTFITEDKLDIPNQKIEEFPFYVSNLVVEQDSVEISDANPQTEDDLLKVTWTYRPGNQTPHNNISLIFSVVDENGNTLTDYVHGIFDIEKLKAESAEFNINNLCSELRTDSCSKDSVFDSSKKYQLRVTGSVCADETQNPVYCTEENIINVPTVESNWFTISKAGDVSTNVSYDYLKNDEKVYNDTGLRYVTARDTYAPLASLNPLERSKVYKFNLEKKVYEVVIEDIWRVNGVPEIRKLNGLALVGWSENLRYLMFIPVVYEGKVFSQVYYLDMEDIEKGFIPVEMFAYDLVNEDKTKIIGILENDEVRMFDINTLQIKTLLKVNPEEETLFELVGYADFLLLTSWLDNNVVKIGRLSQNDVSIFLNAKSDHQKAYDTVMGKIKWSVIEVE